MILEETRVRRILLPFYVLLALALSALVLRYQYFIGDDGTFYARVGAHLAAGKGITVDGQEPYLVHPPFYPLLLGVVNLVSHDLEFSGHLVSMLAFSLTVVPLFFLCRRIYSASTAHWASWLYFTNGFLLIHSNLVMTEALFIFLVMSLAFASHELIQSTRPSIFWAVVTGILGGLASLTRPEGILFYGAGILCLFLMREGSYVPRIRLMSFSSVFFLLFFLPYAFLIHRQTGHLPVSDAAKELLLIRQRDVAHPNQYLEVKQFLYGLTEDRTTIRLYQLIREFDLLECLRKDRFALLRSFFPSLINRLLAMNPYLFGGLAFLLMGAAWFHSPWNERRKKSEAFLLLLLLTLLPQVLGAFMVRRYLIYLTLLLLWEAQGIEAVREWAKTSFRLSARKSVGAALGICLFFASLSAAYLYRTLAHFPMSFETRELGLWMKRNIPDVGREKVATRHPSFNFYSGTPAIWLPYVDQLEDLKSYLANHQARFFVVSNDLEPPFREAYRSLLEEAPSLPQGWRLIHRIAGRSKVFLYEVPPP